LLSPGPARKIIVHLNEDTISQNDFLSAEIIALLLREGIAGATVMRPEAGFGTHRRMHAREGSSEAAQHMPVRIEFIDSAEHVDALLPLLESLVTDGLIEAQDTFVIKAAIGIAR
jgi:uncharacterized protein